MEKELYVIYYRRKLKNGMKRFYLSRVSENGYDTLEFSLEGDAIKEFEDATKDKHPFHINLYPDA